MKSMPAGGEHVKQAPVEPFTEEDSRRVFWWSWRRKLAMSLLQGGNAAGLVRGRISRRSALVQDGYTATATIYPGGVVIKHRHEYQGKPPKGGGGSRGEVTRLSPDSRRRLMLALMRFPWQDYTSGKRAAFAKAAFLTLTYPDAFPGAGSGRIDRDKVKRDLDTLRKRLSRWPSFQGLLWRMEIEPRKSGTHKGEEAPHFHCILVFRDAAMIRAVRRWIAGAWFEIVGSGDPRHRKAGTRTDSIYNPGAGRLMQYLGKYIAKEGDHQAAGRLWGIIGDFPQADGEMYDARHFTLWEFAVERLKRWGRKSRYLKRYQPWWGGLSLYGEPAEFRKIFAGLFDKVDESFWQDFRLRFAENPAT